MAEPVLGEGVVHEATVGVRISGLRRPINESWIRDEFSFVHNHQPFESEPDHVDRDLTTNESREPWDKRSSTP